MEKLPSHIFEQIKRIAQRKAERKAILEETLLITQVSSQQKRGKDIIEIEDFLARCEDNLRQPLY